MKPLGALINYGREKCLNYIGTEGFSEVAKKWPDVATQAESFRSRMFDHIPKPSEGLFRWIATKDGRVELWRKIPAGSFLMGSPEDEKERTDREGPQHRVKIQQPFQMACVPVTQEQFAAFDPGHDSRSNESCLQDPRRLPETVMWFQAMSFCRWLSQAFPWAKGARLPNEEEWEYACRAGTSTQYWIGNKESDLDRVGWYKANSDSSIHPVGRKDANPWGLYDVHGNVWEWTCSEDTSYTRADMAIDPSSPPSALSISRSSLRVVRGGGCWHPAGDARSACRIFNSLGYVIWYRFTGFRVLLPSSRACDL